MPAGAFRGYGATQGTFAVECHLDEIANKLNLDYGELLKRHLITPADEILIGREHEFHIIGSYGMPKAIDRVMEAMDYQPGKPPIVEGCRRRGIGFAASMLASGLAKIYTSTARMSLKEDGRYELRTGAADIGTGSDTTLRQIAAEVLETTVEQIDLIAADTQQAPFDCGSYASSTLFIGGQAVKLAAQALRSLLEEVATTLSISPGEPRVLAQVAIARGFILAAEKSFSTDQVSLTFAFLGVEVEVDTETGRITLLRCVQAVDLGQAINPRVCIGQVQGGVAMGIGYALTEELKRDELGQTLNPSLRTYRIPLARDLPNLEVILVETADIYGPFGAKGVGEIGVNCPAPAIANAVFHATGVRFTEIPLTPERVWRGLKTG
jgi:CO/xanthine dehydrogenase Mo-binding subunit